MADETNFTDDFIHTNAQMEQQPLQQSIEQNASGDGASVISMARPEDDARKIFVGGLSWDTTTSQF